MADKYSSQCSDHMNSGLGTSFGSRKAPEQKKAPTPSPTATNPSGSSQSHKRGKQGNG